MSVSTPSQLVPLSLTQVHILEIFAEAQRFAHRGERMLSWAARAEAREARYRATTYERQAVAARLQGRHRDVLCPACGRPGETRPGTTRVFHFGDDRETCAGGWVKPHPTV